MTTEHTSELAKANAEIEALRHERDIRTEIEAIREAREKRNEERERSLAAERAERELAGERAIEEAERTYGPIGEKIAVEKYDDLGYVIVRLVPLIFRRYQDTGKYDHFESKKMVLPCLVYPDKATFEKMVDARPFIVIHAANAIAILAGVRATDVGGK